jgi:hypothetical protein
MINQLRKILLLISSLLGIIFCIYFIVKFQKYEVTWSLFNYILPTSMIDNINYMLSLIGTFILFLPLTLIILSYLIPDNISLRISASFFGLMSSLIATFNYFYNNQAIYNMRIFIIQKILSIEEKQSILQNNITNITSKITDKNLISYINENIDKNIEIDVLNTLKDNTQIIHYSNKLTESLTKAFMEKNNTLSMSNWNIHPDIIKYIVYCVMGILVIWGVSALLHYFFGSDELLQVVQLQKASAELNLEGLNSLLSTQEGLNLIINLLQRILPTLLQKEELFKMLSENEQFKNLITNQEIHKTLLEKLIAHTKLPLAE